MANKDRTFWCLYMVKDRQWKLYKVRETEWECVDLTYWSEYTIEYWYDETETNYLESIIWHPVMIGSIFERYSASKWFINSQFIIELVEKWVGYDKSIDEQSDECIDYVYSLIPSKSME